MSLENFKLSNKWNALGSELQNLRRIEEGNPPSLRPSWQNAAFPMFLFSSAFSLSLLEEITETDRSIYFGSSLYSLTNLGKAS